MKTQIAIVAGALLTLGTAFSDTVRNDAQSAAPIVVESASTDVSTRATVQVVSMWKDSAKSLASTHLARPL